MCPGILFKIAVSVTLFRHNSFERKNFSIEVPTSKWFAGRLVKVLFYFREPCEREFHALLNYRYFMKICIPEYCLKLPFLSLFLLA